MGPRDVVGGAALALAVLSFAASARAETPGCGPKVTRATVVPCAMSTNPTVRGERELVDAARARELAARVILPSNPVVSVNVGWPLRGAGVAGSDRSHVTWTAQVAQEIEVAGQRGARLEVARAGVTAQVKRAALTEREIAAAALTAYFDALAARDELVLASRLSDIGQGLAASASARAEQGLVSPIDADLAFAASVRVIQARFAAARRAVATSAVLAVVVGLDPDRGPIEVEGELAPLPVPDENVARLVERAGSDRSEITIAEAEAVAGERRVSLLRRSRVPNPTLSIFVENDNLNERALGAGLSFPIPLPGPIGRTNAGEIAEALAIARRARTEVERIQRQVRLEVTTAVDALASRRKELDAFDPGRLARVDAGLMSLGQELSRGRLSVRDALIGQQGLIDLLKAHLEAKRAVCIASVELARIVGLALERGAP